MSTSCGGLVSVGLPVFNGENFLGEAIESILTQTHQQLELIISDNASTDATPEIARAAAAADDRVSYHRNETNLGANPNYNRAFALARGEFFTWHAHDDIRAPDYLAQAVAALEDPAVALVHSRTAYIDRTGRRLEPVAGGFVDSDGYVERLVMDERSTPMLADSRPHVRLDGVVNHLPVFYDVFGVARRSTFQRTSLLPSFYGADKVFLAEMVLAGELVRLDDEAFLRRCHADTSTRSRSLRRLAGWSDASKSFDLFPASMLRGYLAAVRDARLSARDRRRCHAVVARKLTSPYALLRGR